MKDFIQTECAAAERRGMERAVREISKFISENSVEVINNASGDLFINTTRLMLFIEGIDLGGKGN